MQIPLFPLSSVVMPGGLMPLRIFERRYIDMVRDSFKQEGGFGICLVKEGGEVGNAAIPYPYGTRVKIVDWDQEESGLLLIVVEGQEKFRILDTTVDESQLLHGSIELLPEEPVLPVPAEYSYLKETLEQIIKQISLSVKYSEQHLDDALWLGSRLVELLPMSAQLRHELLAMDQPLDRLSALGDIFATIAKRNSNAN